MTSQPLTHSHRSLPAFSRVYYYQSNYVFLAPTPKHQLSIPSTDSAWHTEFLQHFMFYSKFCSSLCLQYAFVWTCAAGFSIPDLRRCCLRTAVPDSVCKLRLVFAWWVRWVKIRRMSFIVAWLPLTMSNINISLLIKMHHSLCISPVANAFKRFNEKRETFKNLFASWFHHW